MTTKDFRARSVLQAGRSDVARRDHAFRMGSPAAETAQDGGRAACVGTRELRHG